MGLRALLKSQQLCRSYYGGTWDQTNNLAGPSQVAKPLRYRLPMYLSSCTCCAPGPPTSLSILVRARLCCSLKGVVHTVVRNLQFHGNFSHGISFISQNKTRLLSLRRKFSFSGHFESIIEPTNADAPDTQLAQRKASFIASLISITVFSCAYIIAHRFSNHQLAF